MQATVDSCPSTLHHGQMSQQIKIISPVMVWPLPDQEDQHLQDCHLPWITATINDDVIKPLLLFFMIPSSISNCQHDIYLNQQMN